MLTRLSIIKLACFALLLLSAVGGWAQERDSLRLLREKERYERRVERYERRRENYRSGWEKMIPKYQVLQFAGSIGLVSIGTGWDYGKHKQWETDFLLGIIPRFSSNETKVTLTLRENYMPWRVKLSDSWEFRPFSVSLGMSTVLDDDFWIREPEKYPAPYYKFSTPLITNSRPVCASCFPWGSVSRSTRERTCGLSVSRFITRWGHVTCT